LITCAGLMAPAADVDATDEDATNSGAADVTDDDDGSGVARGGVAGVAARAE